LKERTKIRVAKILSLLSAIGLPVDKPRLLLSVAKPEREGSKISCKTSVISGLTTREKKRPSIIAKSNNNNRRNIKQRNSRNKKK
jgi:hypothetical protein